MSDTISTEELHRLQGRTTTTRVRQNHEDQLQERVVTMLEAKQLAGEFAVPLWFHHVPNQRTHPAQRVKLSRMGVKAGVADLTFHWCHKPEYTVSDGWCDSVHTGYIELKHEGGRQTDKQKAFQQRMAELGIPYVICRSEQDVEETLEEWGLL